MVSMRALKMGLCAALCLSAIACGGGGGSSSNNGPPPPPPPPPPTNNTASVIVDAGPSNASVNTLFTSVTICVPGSTTSCQTIDHIQVDTGSYGLRILAPVLTSALTTLPIEKLANGNSLAECTQFVDGFSWGPIVTADFQIAGETAKSVPVQIIGDPRLTNIPSECSGTGGTEEDTVSSFGANGILGIGPFELDCGDCDTATHGLYFACATSCTDTMVPANQQVPNPVTHFAADNNGAIVMLPSVAAGGASNVTGSLIFGIDTQTDNASGTETVLTVDDNAQLIVDFNTQTLAMSFIDSGSNGIYFADTNISLCAAPPNDPTSQIVNFYCPASTLTLPITIQGVNGTMTNNLTFGVGNTETMLNSNFDAYPQLAGTLPAGNAGSFDYGLPFFFGKRVAVAVQGAMTTAGTGPYIAF
ncbi:MAG TPA: DUF3443 domain-containing protein [Steroidobacteraceae bacterium]|jgi:hypothetical protein|nr:DUF3443 domain-containing protein [Steroidobacteraceae bacterium]